MAGPGRLFCFSSAERSAILERIRKTRALVVGDFRLDRLGRYRPEMAEPSRETGIPRTAVVSKLDFAPGAATAQVERELEGGLVERLEVETPAVLTIQLGINTPRYASLRSIKQANAKPIECLTPHDVGLADAEIGAAGALSRVRRVFVPERGRGEIIAGTPSQQAARLLEIISEVNG